MSIGTAAIRGVVGPLFVGHGTQKLFGWFGGPGIEGTAGFFESIGLRPGRRHAIAAGVGETLGGALLTLGAFTPLAACMITASMTTAIRRVHGPKGPWVTEQGWEYNAVIIAAMAMVVEKGPGRPSIDERFFPNMKGPAWAVAAIGAGVAGSYLVDQFSEPEPETAPETAGEPAATMQEDARFSREEAPTA